MEKETFNRIEDLRETFGFTLEQAKLLVEKGFTDEEAGLFSPYYYGGPLSLYEMALLDEECGGK